MRSSIMSPLLPVSLLTARLSLFLLLLSFTFSSAAIDEVFVTVHPTTISPPISPNFIGFSLEHDIATSWTGRGHVRPSFVNLMAQLQQTNHTFGGPTLRIGGNSADYSWYNPSGLPTPHLPGFAFTYNITDVDITSLAAGARAANLSLIIGLNFRRPSNASWAVAHMQAIETLVGFEGKTIKGVELGNEVDDYASNGNRLKNYTVQEYYTEFALYSSTLKKEVPNWPAHFFQGAAYGGYASWEADLPHYASLFDSDLSTISVHYYPEYACSLPLPTLPDLLRDRDSTALAAALVNSTAGNLVTILRNQGHPLLLGEGNSVACSGTGNVSNVFGANLWVLDQLYHSAAAGLSQYYFHAHDRVLTHYPPLIWQSDEEDTPTVQPEWYGLMWWAFTTRHHASLLSTSVVNSTNSMIKVWACMTPAGDLSIAILHKDLTAPADVDATVRVEVGEVVRDAVVGELYRLTAPSPFSTNGVSWMGLSWDGSKDGYPSGEPVSEEVSASGGVYSVKVKPISATLLVIRGQGEEKEDKTIRERRHPYLLYHAGGVEGKLRWAFESEGMIELD